MNVTQMIKDAGINSMYDLARHAGIAVSTLERYPTTKPQLFGTILQGASLRKRVVDMLDSSKGYEDGVYWAKSFAGGYTWGKLTVQLVINDMDDGGEFFKGARSVVEG